MSESGQTNPSGQDPRTAGPTILQKPISQKHVMPATNAVSVRSLHRVKS